MAISVVVAVEPVADELIGKLTERMGKLRTGDGRRGCDMGPLVTKEHRDRVAGYIDIAAADGATVVVDGRNQDFDGEPSGFWLGPTLLDRVPITSKVYSDEIFGPVLSVISFRTPQEGIDKANNTPFGLSAGIWSEKGSRTLWASQQLRAGVIWANTFNKFDPTSPFGGYKESGWGREGGKHGLAAYLKTGKESGGK